MKKFSLLLFAFVAVFAFAGSIYPDTKVCGDGKPAEDSDCE